MKTFRNWFCFCSMVCFMSCVDTQVSAPGEVRSFNLQSYTPAINTLVDSSTVLSATFDWDLNVLEFYPDEYFIRFVFEGQFAGDFGYPETYVFTDMYDIKSVRSSASLNFPLSKIWNDPLIKHPLRVRLELLAKVSPTRIRSLEQSATIKYTE